MIKRFLSRLVPQEEWPVWAVPGLMLIAFIASGIIAYLAYFGPTMRDISGLAYAPTDDAARVRVDVGGTLFAAPAHFTRNRQTRRNASLSHAEFHALLPDLTPWREDNAAAFLRTDGGSSLLVISIRAADRILAADEVFDTIYQPYIVGGGVVRDDGLQGFGFRGDAPHASKEIFRALTKGSREQRAAAPLFICDRIENPSPSCESRFDLGNKAQASYRFKRAHLADWENIDRQVKDMVRNFRAAARSRY
jgi:hypothetical protein